MCVVRFAMRFAMRVIGNTQYGDTEYYGDALMCRPTSTRLEDYFRFYSMGVWRKSSPTPAASPGAPSGRAARLLNDEPTRIYVPLLMRPWTMQTCHANASCHLGLARTLAMLDRFY